MNQIIALILMGLILLASKLNAATFVVTNTANDDSGKLR